MKYLINILILALSILTVFGNDTIRLNNTSEKITGTNMLTGINGMSLHDQLVFRQTPEGTVDSVYMSSELQQMAAPLGISLYRFPGGTPGNYYHFYGNGYGIDTNEVNCIPGKINNPWAAQFLGYDRAMDKNAMYYFADEMKKQKQSGKDIRILLSLNTHTHFYQGDLQAYSARIQQLLMEYTNNNLSLLDGNGDDVLDSTNIDWYAWELYNIQSGNTLQQIRNELLQDSGFRYRLGENLASIQYLKEQGLPVIGIELGNETYDEYVIFDDNLQYINGDCTTEGLVVPPPHALPLRYYFEGLLKNRLITSIYTDTLRKLYGNIPVGIPAASRLNYFSQDSAGQPVFIKRYELYGKKRDLWNYYFSIQPDINALIPHLYFQEFLPCDEYLDFEDKRLAEVFAAKAIRAYCDSSITYNLGLLPAAKYNKSIWVTEWNFTDVSFATNTFLHAQYIYEFFRQIVLIKEQSPKLVDGWIYHMLASGYYPWPLFRTQHIAPESLFIEKQIQYHPYYIWSSTLSQPVARLNNTPLLNNANVLLDIFSNTESNEWYVHFINTDTITAKISLKDHPLLWHQKAAYISNSSSYILRSESLTSTQFTPCNTVWNNGNNNNYTIIEENNLPVDTLLIPALSMGKYTLLWDTTQITTALPQHKNTPTFLLYPNPASDYINIRTTQDFLMEPSIYVINDLTGKQVQCGKITGNNTVINRNGIPAGLYLINLQNNKQHTEYQKITLY